jgi:NAD(P)-dependent dehydrogenase (short-subunit alcohol dehydrogenase family)
MKTAVVTGGASGLGLACAHHLVGAGWHVAVLDAALDAALEAGGAEIEGDRLRSAVGDVTDEAGFVAVLDTLLNGWPPLRGLVNSAGMARDIAFMETDAALFRKIMDVNVTGTFIASKACAARMAAGGAIVNFSSVSGLRGNKGRVAYGASKAAVVSMTQVMAVELAGRGIRVNALAPGPIDTAMTKAMHSSADREQWTRLMALKRYGTPEEIAGLVAFLLSDETAFVTGTTMIADGGFMAAGLMPDVD